ncbi:MAG: 4Fe-4S binding protein [Desulfovibrionaceae bacterium]|nr:4Fe-4S binding protein [Desulfovibrionaceae bacterium]
MKITLSPSRFRLAVQAAFTLFCLYAGYRFIGFVAWASGRSETFVPKPGSVEGFLPISALMGFRQLLETGRWDPVHPAGLTIFLAVLTMALLFRKGFCGYVCPVGFLSSLLERTGRRLGLAVIPPRWLDLPLHGVKYLLLAGFCIAVFSMDPRSLRAFITGPYNMVADAGMLAFFLHPSALALAVIGLLAVASLAVRNFWCRYLCPYGALLGLIAWFGPTAVQRNADICVHCGACRRQCPSGIDVQGKTVVRSPECIGCGRCVETCPVEGCLSFSVLGKKRIHWAVAGAGAVAVLLPAWLWASSTGHWDSALPAAMVRRFYSAF